MKKLGAIFFILIIALNINYSQVNVFNNEYLNVNNRKLLNPHYDNIPIIYSSSGRLVIFPIVDNLKIESNFLFIKKGMRIKYEDNNIFLETDSFEIPVLFKFKPVNNLAVYAGSQIGVITKAKTENNSKTEEIKKNLNNIRYNLKIGGQYMMNDLLFFDARFIFGLETGFTEDVKDTNKEKNKTIQLSVGYLF